MAIALAGELKQVEVSVRKHTEGYYHSSNVVEYKAQAEGKTVSVEFDLRDFMVISALTGMNVMISGKTGGGKTKFSTAVVNALFGGNYGFLQIDTGLSETKFRDMAFEVIKRGGNLSDAGRPSQIITAPAVILDEYNRAPAVLTDMLQGWLVNGFINFDGGRMELPGVQTQSGRYQLKIATINEGDGYVGTHAIDKAGRDRFHIEFPFDVFQPSNEDRRNFIINGPFSNGISETAEDLSETIFKLHAATKGIDIEPLVIEFGVYLLNKDNCYKSPEGTKLTFDHFSPSEICSGCVAQRSGRGNVCGEILAPSERALSNTFELSKAFALYRVYKNPKTELTVTFNDLNAAAQFTLYRKLEISPGWVHEYGGMSTWEATRSAMSQMYLQYINSFRSTMKIIQKQSEGKRLTREDKGELTDQARKDPPFGTRDEMVEIYRHSEDVTGNSD